MVDSLTPEQRSKTMRAVKSKETKIEKLLREELWRKGYRYRKNNPKVFGKPDITFKKYKIAIFVDSEFWHGKDLEKNEISIKSNKDFWISKLKRNKNRDIDVNNFLSATGWKVLRFWGKDILQNLEDCITKIEFEINEAKRKSIY